MARLERLCSVGCVSHTLGGIVGLAREGIGAVPACGKLGLIGVQTSTSDAIEFAAKHIVAAVDDSGDVGP